MIKVDYGVLDAAHTQMINISKGIDQKLDTLRQGLMRLEWNGNDRQAYQEKQAAWDTAVQDINALLNEIGMAVGIAKTNYETTEMENSKLFT